MLSKVKSSDSQCLRGWVLGGGWDPPHLAQPYRSKKIAPTYMVGAIWGDKGRLLRLPLGLFGL
jgi:hypothetical protein